MKRDVANSAPQAQERSLAKRLWYDALRIVCRVYAAAFLKIRCEGRQNIPGQGGALVCSNHQSQLDPVLLGMAFDNRLNYLARQSLFRFTLFRWLILSLDAIPIDREGTGLSGLKETLKRLKRGEMVLIFPEGTRTEDGEIGPLKPGFLSVAKRAGVPLLPMVLEGAYEAWPKGQSFPVPKVIQVEIGRPIPPGEIERLSEEAVMAELDRRLKTCLEMARQKRNRRIGRHAIAPVLPIE